MNTDDYKEAYKRLEFIKENNNFPKDEYRDLDNTSIDAFFLKSALEYDIITNALSIVMNMLCDNEKSQGIDNNCRSILEAFAILNEVTSPHTYVTGDRLRMFRHSYAIIEYHNERSQYDGLNKKLQQGALDQSLSEQLNRLNKSIEEFKKYAKKVFPGNSDTIDRNSNEKSGFPNLYLNKKFNEVYNVRNDVTKYGKAIHKDLGKMYHFFSTMIHPWCETDLTIEAQIMDKRKEYIDDVLKMALDYVNLMEPTYQSDIVEDFETMFNQHNVSNGTCIIMSNYTKICDLMGNATDQNKGIPLLPFNRIGLTAKDLYLCLATHNYQNEIIKFKSIYEMYAYITFLQDIQSDTERSQVIDALVLSTRVRLLDLSLMELSNKHRDLYNKVHDLYTSYYQNKYHTIEDFDDFYIRLKKSWYFPITENNCSIKSVVNEQVKKHLLQTNSNTQNCLSLIEDMEKSYNVSLDLEHASGYCYNLSEGVLEQYTIGILEHASILIEELHDNNFNFGCDSFFFENIIQMVISTLQSSSLKK